MSAGVVVLGTGLGLLLQNQSARAAGIMAKVGGVAGIGVVLLAFISNQLSDSDVDLFDNE